MLWLVALALLCTTQVTEGTNPGVKLRLNKAGIDYGRQVAMEAFKNLLNKTPMIKILQTLEIQIPQSAVSFAPETGISLSMSNANINITGNWKKSCYIYVSASDVSGSSVIKVTWADEALPSLSNAKSNFKIGSVRVKVRGGESCVNNESIKKMEHQAKHDLTELLNKVYEEAITNLEDVVKTMNIFANVNELIGIDYSLIHRPAITKQHMDLDCKGKFYSSADGRDPSFSPAQLFFPDQSDCMLNVAISEAYANSAAHAYYFSKQLELEVDISKVLNDQGINFTTDNFKDMLPEVPKCYPNKMVVLKMAARKRPVVTFLPEKIAFKVYGSYWAYAVLSHSELASLFHVDMDVDININVAVLPTNLRVVLTLGDFSISNASSSFGYFEIQQAKSFLTTLLKNIVVPKVNENLFDGFPLPIFNKLSLVNPMLTLNMGHVLICTDMRYSR